jgi:hypothetical protein
MRLKREIREKGDRIKENGWGLKQLIWYYVIQSKTRTQISDVSLVETLTSGIGCGCIPSTSIIGTWNGRNKSFEIEDTAGCTRGKTGNGLDERMHVRGEERHLFRFERKKKKTNRLSFSFVDSFSHFNVHLHLFLLRWKKVLQSPAYFSIQFLARRSLNWKLRSPVNRLLVHCDYFLHSLSMCIEKTGLGDDRWNPRFTLIHCNASLD